jgi:vitamin B12 transporter
MSSGYIQDQVNLLDFIFPTIGGRVDYHTRFGVQPTLRAGSVFHIKRTQTRIRATIGTGFKAPSLYQIYSEYGDRDLHAEKSAGWDCGVEQTLSGGKILIGVTVFGNRFDNLIDFDEMTWTYMNVARAESKGVEAAGSVRPIPFLELSGNYTYTDARDLETGLALLQRPRHKIRGEMLVRLVDRAELRLTGSYVGRRYDYPRISMDAYKLFNIYASYDITPNITVFARGNNLLDEKYEEVKGYGTAGISGHAGFRVSIR